MFAWRSPDMPRSIALGLLAVALVACGPPTADEPPPPAEEWLVGEWFHGSWGDSYGELDTVSWTRVDADGTWTYGYRGCNGEWMMFGGAWREVEPGIAEFSATEEGGILPFDGYLGEIAVMRYEDTCAPIDVVYFDADGDPYTRTHTVTRGVACLDDCSNSSLRLAVPCPGAENPCEGQ
jgi:hypothetical protein